MQLHSSEVKPTLISFVRHGHVSTLQEVYYGRLPQFRLSQMGVIQAKATSVALQDRNIESIFSSPLLRARQTASIIQSTLNLPSIRISHLLNEVKTPFDGYCLSDIYARNWDLYSHNLLGYEQPADILSRAMKFITKIRFSYVGKHLAAITHGDFIAYLILWANAVPISIKAKDDFRCLGLPDKYPNLGSITTLTFYTSDDKEQPSIKYCSPSHTSLFK